MALRKKKKQSRTIVLSDSIDNETVGSIIEDIYEFNYEDRGLGVEDREPVDLILNSFGGGVYDGLALIGCMEQSNTPVHTNVLGSCMSMGLLILCYGHIRTCSKYATFMYHGIAYEMPYEKIKYHKQEIKEADRLQKLYNKMLVSKTKLTLELLDEILLNNNEIYWDPTQALKLGIVSKIN